MLWRTIKLSEKIVNEAINFLQRRIKVVGSIIK